MAAIVMNDTMIPANTKGVAGDWKDGRAALAVADGPAPELECEPPEAEPPDAPAPVVWPADDAVAVEAGKTVSVTAAANSWVDAYVWQFDEGGMEGVYGGEKGATAGWNQVVTWPFAAVKTPGGVMSSESHTVNEPLMEP